MDLLIFERKRGIPKNYVRPVSVPNGQYHGILNGEQVLIKNVEESDDLIAFGCFGEFLQRREPRISVECFESDTKQQQQQREEQQHQGHAKATTTSSDCGVFEDAFTAAAQQTNRAAKAWKELWPVDDSLRLNMEEAIYLSSELGVLQIFSGDGRRCEPDMVWKKFYDSYGMHFIRRYAAYRYFRRLGWIVRSGLQYGVDFMLYCDGPEYHHSSAAVRIVSEDSNHSDSHYFIARNRALNNMKKTLIEVIVAIPQDLDVRKIESIYHIVLSNTTARTWKISDKR